ncbi:hypothetical protein DICSQDRAFT_136300 [Dichomitus squalens LYAD-421 SS1]|uniref:BHLH domain-containing protein n=1 Tax=Dichomitus squalens (strain LYAD-421) TaxID=732165 RepID=R7T022_DICSQ|nr:uncharacterized protein DICSQDRAFT_136300 [Dichomitus squalens LYAD-421 SS1]EJF61784.1 hypothetical protein DICSQDRAFT_136300 [Dichomitus squalens LYAD-421 SS1]
MSSAPKETPLVYAASCNPPRRAKRQRTGSLVGGEGQSQAAAASPTSSVAPFQQRRAPARPPILPKQPATGRGYADPASPNLDSGSDEEDDYDPGRDAAPAPKRRGRKPGTMSRSARESLRKLNHSRIEKARRTKINETLATLSTFVNERGRVLASQRPEAVVEVPAEENGKKAKGKTEEKEFKLDVLVKTVEYMQDLVARVQALEARMCSQCRTRGDNREDTSLPPSPKRKRADEDEAMVDVSPHLTRRSYQRHEEEDSYTGDDEHGLGAAEEEQPSPMPFAVPNAAAAESNASPRLPPISSWLSHPYDPSTLISKSSNAVPARSPANAQLPSPPPSGRFLPAITLANMPSLALPAPAHPFPPQQQASGSSTTARQQHRKSVSASPTVSPTWTPEDETAASLLLQMSVKPRSSSISSTSGGGSSVSSLPRSAMMPMTPREEVPMAKDRAFPAAQQQRSMEVVTPGSLLGMRD